MDELSIGEARRMALAAQGFTEKRPRGTVGRKHLQKVVDRLGVIQLDSVNVAVRSHYMPFFSRLGPYALAELDTLAWGTHHLFEYWGHQASLLPVEQHPLHRWKMEQRRHDRQAGWLTALEKEHPGYVAAVLDEVRERGPLAAGELSDPGKKSGPWWGYSKGKQTLVLGGLAAGSAVLVAVPEPRLGALRRELGSTTDAIRFEDMSAVGRNPGRIL